MTTLGKRLKKARKSKKLTQEQVAKQLGISFGTLSGYERDYREPDAETIAKLATIYQVPIAWLVTGHEEQTLRESSVPYGNELIKDTLDFNDEEVIENYELIYDGVPLTEEQVKKILSYIRFVAQEE